jgi:hypothetical protein
VKLFVPDNSNTVFSHYVSVYVVTELNVLYDINDEEDFLLCLVLLRYLYKVDTMYSSLSENLCNPTLCTGVLGLHVFISLLFWKTNTDKHLRSRASSVCALDAVVTVKGVINLKVSKRKDNLYNGTKLKKKT